jgi:hypothetical protein
MDLGLKLLEEKAVNRFTLFDPQKLLRLHKVATAGLKMIWMSDRTTEIGNMLPTLSVHVNS